MFNRGVGQAMFETSDSTKRVSLLGRGASRGRRHVRPWAAAIVAVLGLLSARPAAALIDPKFTPIHLTSQSEGILELEVGPPGPESGLPVRVVRSLKGTSPDQPPILGTAKADPVQADRLRSVLGRAAKRSAALFIGAFAEARQEPPKEDFGMDFGLGPGPAPQSAAPKAGAAALLHVAGRWFRFKKGGQGWLLEGEDVPLQGCWAGGTDMLLRAVAYVLADPDPAVPVAVDATWGAHRQVGQAGGTVSGAMAVDPEGRGRLCLFISSDGGDRLFGWNRARKTLEDLTAAWKLESKSKAAAWGDFDGDGRLDLASWDGRRLALWLQTSPGSLLPRHTWAPSEVEVTSLAALDVGLKGRAGLLAGTAAGPVLLTPTEDGRWSAMPLPRPNAALLGESPGATGAALRPAGGATDLAPTTAPLVADFDGDDVGDVLVPLAGAAVLYPGEKPGALRGESPGATFAAPKVLGGVGTGKGPAYGCVGDFDADGLLDVFLATERGFLLWQNRGQGQFEETLQEAGEVAYIAKPRGVACGTGDVNNDGRQDVCLLYADRPPQVFFNRGFRSFGHARELDLQERELLPASGRGQQAGLLADLSGDGAQDLALVLRDGAVWLFERAVDRPALALRVALPAGGPTAGPLRVLGFSGDRPLGAWNVFPGTAEAFFGRDCPGPCRIEWRPAGGGREERRVIVESGPVRVLLAPAGTEQAPASRQP